MQNGYYQATGAMVTQFNRLDIITNNLANVNTSGYKKDDVVIADFERIFKETKDALPLENHTKDSAKFLNRTLNRVPHINEVYTDFGTGGLKHTNNPLDISLGKNDLFLLVDSPSGIRLTKNGSLNLDSEGYLVTKEGYRVLPSNYAAQQGPNRGIQIPQDTQMTVDKDGNIYAGGEPVGRFYIAQPRELRDLQKEGDNLYKLDNMDGLTDNAVSGSIAQGYAQISNVNPVKEMVSLIETQRMVDMYQKVMTTHMSDLNQDAINKLASMRAN